MGGRLRPVWVEAVWKGLGIGTNLSATPILQPRSRQSAQNRPPTAPDAP
jgi:hypothetical protein